MKSLFLRTSFVCNILLASVLSASAASSTWIGLSGSSSNFSDSNNWIAGAVPGANSDVVFGPAGLHANPVEDVESPFLTGGLFLNSITFNALATTPYTISGTNSLFVTVLNGITNSASALHTFTLPVRAADGGSQTQTWNVVSGGGLNFNNSVSLQGLNTFNLNGAGDYKFLSSLSVTGTVAAAVALNTSGLVTFDGVNVGLGTMSVNAGTLAGIGTLNSLTTINTATLSPGDAGTGTLTLQSGLTLNPTTTLSFDLGTSQDLVAITSGSFTLDGTLNVNDSGGLTTGTYNLFNYSGASLLDNGLIVGTLPGGFSGSIFNDPASSLIQLKVTAVPEPSSVLLMLGAVAGFGIYRRFQAKS
jgi:hypothetical protein